MCRFSISIFFNLWSVVIFLSGRISLPALRCTKVNLFFSPLKPLHTTDALSIRGLMWALKKIPRVSVSVIYLTVDRRKTRSRNVLHHESWTLTAELQRRIQAMETRCYRMILHISYKDLVTNEGSPCQDPAGYWTTWRSPDDRKKTQPAVVWLCLPFIRSGQNHLARHSERGKKFVSWCFKPSQPQRITSGL